MPRKTIAALLSVACLGLLLALPAGAQFVSNYLGRTFTSNAPSGVNGFACRTNGCRVDLGTGAGDHLYSDGTNVVVPSSVTSSYFSTAGGSTYSSGAMKLAPGQALPTCVVALEGYFYRQSGTGGTGTGAQTRFCVCVSDGAASPAYSWRNLISGTAGTATTCNP